jgi:hypothetical protein
VKGASRQLYRDRNARHGQGKQEVDGGLNGMDRFAEAFRTGYGLLPP